MTSSPQAFGRPTAGFHRRVRGLWLASRGRLKSSLTVALLALSACGGGTQYVSFVPNRLFAFGDETSALLSDGTKYTDNGLNGTGAVDCSANPLWVQSLASSYGFVFAECNPTFVATPLAKMYAAFGARVDDVAAQVEAQVAAGGFRDNDLATLLVGANDILALYGTYPARSESDLTAEIKARGQRLAEVANRLVDLGVKVILSDVPDQGLTPYASGQKKIFPEEDRASLLSRLTQAFNEQLGVNIVLDGRYIGLMQTQLRLQAVARAPGSFGFGNVTDAACTVELPLCTTSTRVSDASTTTYLWADQIHLTANGQAQLAQLADRARRNPF